jgi:alpha-L-fucosidase
MAEDIRFTTRGETLYAITLGEPKGQVSISSLGRATGTKPHVRGVKLLGVAHPLEYRQTDTALVIDIPDRLPTRHSSVFRIAVGSPGRR